MFKLSAIGCNKRKKTPAPLLDRRINDALIKFIRRRLAAVAVFSIFLISYFNPPNDHLL
jgi:hypothetical protein